MAEKLKRYNEKRNFAVTNEPKGRRTKSGDKLRFSVQHHDARSDHYDLRLEHNGVALSWAVPKGPSFKTGDKRLAMRVEDHPVDYMDFEGIIPKGQYGGGTVMLWDEGEWIPRLDPEKGLRDGSLKFRLDGKRLKGDWALVKMRNSEDGDPWLLIKEKDEYAKDTSGISEYSTGVRSGKSMDEIANDGAINPFDSAEVMLSRLCASLPRGEEWVYELKYDGYRVLGFAEAGRVQLKTRNGHDCTANFRPAADALIKALNGRSAVVDGEMVVAVDGVSDFSALQASIKSGKTDGLGYVLFDLLALDGEDLRSKPLMERKLKLEELIRSASPMIGYSRHVENITDEELEALKRRGIEGIVAKRANSPYSAGRNGDWQKLKFRNDNEFVIGGYNLTEAGALKSLLLGYYEGKRLIFAGSVGTGFTEDDRRELKKELSEINIESSPFEHVPKGHGKAAIWVSPNLAAQVEYAEMTSAGLLRQASFKGLRRDKEPKDISYAPEKAEKKAEKISSKKRPVVGKKQFSVSKIKITHPEKIMFPAVGVTKGELAEYYALVAPRMIPHIANRLLSLVCCPSGIKGEKFFRKHLDNKIDGVEIAPADDEQYFYITNETGLLSLVQNNTVEFHVCANRNGENPDIMLFDLDPDEGLELDEVRRGVKDVKSVLDELGLKSFLKTSGGKGYHIVVPLSLGADPQAFRNFAKRVAEILETKYPERFTSSISKKARVGKIFVDWQRNTPSSTAAAPYSVRAREKATVSCPILWKELDKIAPDEVTIQDALKRLDKPDPWHDFFKVKLTQTLSDGE